jgi:cobalamin biosynthesis Mg chelatase CobN
VLAAGAAVPAMVTAGGDDDSWNVKHLAALDIPILQGLCLTSSRATWAASDNGLSPRDVATQVAVPEFDGRIIAVPFSFKEIDAEGLISYVPDPERCARVAGLAVNYATLRRVKAPDKRVALVFSSYPTKYSRIGNAVGLDSPASMLALLNAMRDNGYQIGDVPGVESGDGDALMHALIDRMPYEKGHTSVETTAAQSFAAGRGVNQDHAHVFVSCCRELGVPARYVSGYVYTPDREHVASHAWAEGWLSNRWISFDVGNARKAGEAHLKLAAGLDYLDACPVRGVRLGGGEEVLHTSARVDAGASGH